MRSRKEAFCLANTDAVDYTVKNADWQPDNTDLSTRLRRRHSVAVREVLDVGSGDTYGQSLPGQSFDITDVPNGTYFVEVIANPDRTGCSRPATREQRGPAQGHPRAAPCTSAPSRSRRSA